MSDEVREFHELLRSTWIEPKSSEFEVDDGIDVDANFLALYYFHLATIHEARVRESLWRRVRVYLVNLTRRLSFRKGVNVYSADKCIRSARQKALKLARKHRQTGVAFVPLPPGIRELQHLPADGDPAADYLSQPSLLHTIVAMPMPDLYALIKNYVSRDDIAFMARLQTWSEENTSQVSKEARSILDLCEISLDSRNGLYSIVVDKCEIYVSRYGPQNFILASMWQEYFRLYANALSRLGRHSDAGIVLDRGISKLRNSVSLVRKKASILASTGNSTGALMELARLERKGKAYAPRDQLLKSVVLEMQGEYALAALEVERALARPNCPSDVYLQASNIALRQQNTDASQLSIDKYFASYALRTVGSSSSGRPVTLPEIENRRPAAAKLGPLVTVIMTAYRAEATVRFAVESVLAQSYSNLELIVVEDGGGDGTFDLLRGLALEDPRLVAIANEENIGTYRSKNRALKCAKGEFITFHDSDDWWHPDHVMEHMKYMSEHRGLMASTSKWARIDDRGFFQLARSGLFLHLNPASMFVCRKVVSEIGGFDASTTGADSEYVQRIRTVFGTRSIGMISKPLTLGLHRPDSLTQSGEGAYDENRYSAVREAYRARWLDWQRQAANTSERLYISLEETSSRFLN